MAPVKPFTMIKAPLYGQDGSLLYSIPAELRNEIYRFYFDDNVEIPRRRRNTARGRAKAPALLLVCKQAHLEAIGLFYNTAAFCFSRGAAYRLPQWLKTIGPARASLIQTVHLTSPGTSHYMRSFNFFDGRSRVLISGGDAEAFLQSLPEYGTLSPGALKFEIVLPHGSIWTNTPMELAEEIADAMAYQGLGGWAWKAGTGEGIKRLDPSMKVLEEVSEDGVIEE